MSPHLKRDDCDVFGTNCNSGIRPTTYATAIAIVLLVLFLASCFFVHRRRQSRPSLRPATPGHTQSHPLAFHYNQPPPPPVFPEPAPPYDVFKAPSPSPSPHPATGQSNEPLLQPQPPAPLQYPPPSYTPA